MKPKTALERKIISMCGKLPPITEKQRRWAFDNLFERKAYYWPSIGRVKCMHCGDEAKLDKDHIAWIEKEDLYNCPFCGSACFPKRFSKELPFSEGRFFTIITTYRSRQVARTFDVHQYNKRGESTEYSAEEVFQHWLTDDGKEIIAGCPHQRSPFSLSFSPTAPWSIKHHNGSATGAFVFDDLFDLCNCEIYPEIRVTPLLKRNGWRKDLLKHSSKVSVINMMRWLLTVPDAEMLCKTGQEDMFIRMVRNADHTLPYRYAVCIANRRGYIIEDASMWLDMMRFAGQLGMDLHNPEVVCPEDLKFAHDLLLARVAKKKRKIDALGEKERAVALNDDYIRDKGKYIGIKIEAKGLRISVIPSVPDVYEEGEAMHHCVYKAAYYSLPESLLLSARDEQGQRLETVELSLRTFKVLQSRAILNGTTPQHKRIISLVESNASLFQAAANSIK